MFNLILLENLYLHLSVTLEAEIWYFEFFELGIRG